MMLANRTGFFRRTTIYLLLAGLVAFGAPFISRASQPYLDDSNKSAPGSSGAPSFDQHLYPRVLQHEMMGGATAYALSKYNFIDVHGVSFDAAEAVQSNSPSTMILRHISGREYQGYTQNDPCYISTGVAFAGTGPSSQGGPKAAGCNIYAGHWLYKAGSPLTQGATASVLTLHVQDASRFTVGQYVVIYDAPAGSFRNPEHALVAARDTSKKTVTLRSRGYKSSAVSNGVGSIVAQHVLGQGTDNRLWAFNFSSRSPKDGSGRIWA